MLKLFIVRALIQPLQLLQTPQVSQESDVRDQKSPVDGERQQTGALLHEPQFAKVHRQDGRTSSSGRRGGLGKQSDGDRYRARQVRTREADSQLLRRVGCPVHVKEAGSRSSQIYCIHKLKIMRDVRTFTR